MTALRLKHIILSLLMLAGGVFSQLNLSAQDGVVIINEFNAAESATGACADYIELKNLGPKDQDIGCYTLISDKKAIRIPPGTIIKAGKIITISFGTVTCDGTTANPTINLQNCNCTTAPNNTPSKSWFFDHFDSNGSNPLVLLDASNNVRDAVRTKGSNNSLANVPTDNIALPNFSGACSVGSYAVSTNTGTGTIYESINETLGNNSSLSRSGDGSCTWFKTTPGINKTPGLTNLVRSETVGTVLTVTNDYQFSCTNPISSLLSFNVTSSTTPLNYFYQYVFSQDNIFNETATKFSGVTSPTQNFVNPSPGFYNFLIAPSETSTCGQRTFSREIISPTVTASLTQNYDCIGGTAAFTLTGAGATNITNPSYYPLSATVTNTTSLVSRTVTRTNTESILFTNLTAGTYSVTITPNSSFACPTALSNFVVNTLPATSLTATITTTPACDDGSTNGIAKISITNNQPQDYYPINYILRNTATSAIVATNTISQTVFYINNLPPGSYSLELDPALGGCLTSYFTIDITSVGCDPLAQRLKSFTGKNIGAENEFNIEIDTDDVVEKIHLESSENGNIFNHVGSIPFEKKKGMQTLIYRSPVTEHTFYRLELHDVLNRLHNSSVIRITSQRGDLGINAYPNPAGDHITLNKFSSRENGIRVLIMTSSGKIVYEEQFTIRSGNNSLKVPTGNLPKGQYVLSIYDVSTGTRQSSTIIK